MTTPTPSDPTTPEVSEVEALRAERDEIAAYALKLQIALTSLAGGGSENFVRHGDDFRADILACRIKIERRKSENMDAVKSWARRATTAEAALSAAQDQIAKFKKDAETVVGMLADTALQLGEVKAALQPFARTFRSAPHDALLHEEQVIECFTRNEVLHLELRVSDFRRARAALTHTRTEAEHGER